jgi:hypothetical protein
MLVLRAHKVLEDRKAHKAHKELVVHKVLEGRKAQ